MTIFASLRRVQATSLTVKAVAVAVFSLALAGCEHLDEKPSHSAGWTLLDPTQRHPILVSQQRQGMNVHVGRNQHGLSSTQRAQIYSFLEKYRSMDGGNSRVVISVPAGSANEVSAMRAVADMRPMLEEHGFGETAVSIEPYHADGGHAPIKVGYMRYNAEAPECGRWPDDLSRTSRNHNYHNFGCAQQRNLANMVANPADLVSPRTMTPSIGARRDTVYEKYIKGEPTGATRSSDERSTRAN